MNFFKNDDKEVFFVTKNFNKTINKRCDLVLSPEFYWVKKVKLDIKFVHVVKNMAFSIFDGELPSGEFSYKVFKLKKNEFIIIAYNIIDILRDLKNLSINRIFIDKIYTLQSEIATKDMEIKIDDQMMLLSLDDILALAPIKFMQKEITLSIDDMLEDKKLSNNYIYSSKFKKVKINNRDIISILSILALLNIAIVLDIVKTERYIDFLHKQKRNFIRNNSLPATKFQLDAMSTELKNKYNIQIPLRIGIDYVARYKLEKNEYFSSIEFKNGILRFALKAKNKKAEENFRNFISKKMQILKSYKKDNLFIIEIRA